MVLPVVAPVLPVVAPAAAVVLPVVLARVDYPVYRPDGLANVQDIGSCSAMCYARRRCMNPQLPNHMYHCTVCKYAMHITKPCCGSEAGDRYLPICAPCYEIEKKFEDSIYYA